MPARITSVEGLADAYHQAQLLKQAVAAIDAGDESFEALDRRDDALRELWRLGAVMTALVALSGMSVRAIREIVRGARPDGRRYRERVTVLLLALAEQELDHDDGEAPRRPDY